MLSPEIVEKIEQRRQGLLRRSIILNITYVAAIIACVGAGVFGALPFVPGATEMSFVSGSVPPTEIAYGLIAGSVITGILAIICNGQIDQVNDCTLLLDIELDRESEHERAIVDVQDHLTSVLWDIFERAGVLSSGHKANFHTDMERTLADALEKIPSTVKGAEAGAFAAIERFAQSGGFTIARGLTQYVAVSRVEQDKVVELVIDVQRKLETLTTVLDEHAANNLLELVTLLIPVQEALDALQERAGNVVQFKRQAKA